MSASRRDASSARSEITSANKQGYRYGALRMSRVTLYSWVRMRTTFGRETNNLGRAGLLGRHLAPTH